MSDGVAVITIDHPPVNALGAATVAAVMEQLAAAARDPAISAAVLHGAGGNFSAGADIAAFANPDAKAATTRDLLAQIDGGDLPVVAALAGNVLGAGLEVALACDYRVAAARARIGFPEIKLGLLPGAEGTQRLPRLIGAAQAVKMIVGGEPVSGAEAGALALVDRVTAGDPLPEALALARTLARGAKRRTSAMQAAPENAAVAAARAAAPPAERGGLAARAALDCIDDALVLPFAEGSRRERERFAQLRASEQSRARVHLFFAEREAAKLPAGNGAAPFRASTAAVIGGGTMGTGIAMAFANAGIAVHLVDVDAVQAERARATVAANYGATLRKGRLTQAEHDARLARIAFGTGLEAAARVDVVVEAVFEDMDIKRALFAQLDGIAAPGTLLATNTSTLDVDAIAASTARPADVVGLHFFSPANVMKLLEIVRGAQTSPDTLANALALGKQIKKIPVVAGNCDGFIGNRMLYPYRRQAEFLLEEGASPQQVDRVVRDFGFAMGPFAMADLAGLDIGWRIRKRRNAERPPVGRYSHVADRLCELGRFGQKTGAGYYRYASGDRTPLPDPAVDELIANVAREAGIARRDVSDEEILKRCVYALVNEAAAILEEGIAARPGDIDVVWVYGYSFPAFRGGPLRYADRVGIANVARDMEDLGWTPAPLVRELAARGETFAAWQKERAWATR